MFWLLNNSHSFVYVKTCYSQVLEILTGDVYVLVVFTHTANRFQHLHCTVGLKRVLVHLSTH